MLFGQFSQPQRDPKELESKPFQEVQSIDAFLGYAVVHCDHTARLEAFLESVGGTTRNLPGCHEPGYYALHLASVELIAPRWALPALQELIQRCGSQLEPTEDFRDEWDASGHDIKVFRAQRTSPYSGKSQFLKEKAPIPDEK